MNPKRLKLGTHADSGQMYRVYRNQAAAAYSSLYFFIFLSNFQTLHFFITLFSGTVRPRKLELGTQVGSRQLYHVYKNQVAAAYSSCYFFIFLSNFQTLQVFVTLFSGTVRPCRLKLGTRGRCVLCTRIGLLLLIHPFISSFFFLNFSSHFSQEL